MAKRKVRGGKEAKEREKREAKEAKEKAKREAKEAKKKAKREAKEAKEKLKAQKAKEREKRKAKEAKEKAKREAQEAKEAKEATKKAKKVKPAKEKTKKAEPPKEKPKKAAEGVELFQGMVTLNIMPPIDLTQLDSFKGALLKVSDLRVVVMSGAVAEGSRILISVEEPLPLLDILKKIPAVGGVVPKGSNIEVSLKTS